MLNNIVAVALLSYKEGLKQRLLYGIMLFALVMMLASVLLSGLYMRDIAKITLDFCLAAISIGGLLVPFFIAVSLLSRDIERRTIFTLLARAISRGEYVLGKFLALVLLTGTIMGILSLAGLGALWTSKALYGAHFFTNVSLPALVAAISFDLLGIVLLTAVTVLWSTLTSSSFLVTLLVIATYIIGNTMEELIRFMSSPPPGTEISPVLLQALTVVQYIFPNLAAFDFKLAAAHGLMPPGQELLFLSLYGTGYIAAALCLAVLLFKRRDLL